MIFSWFDAKEAKEFGELLAQMLIERTPVDEAVSKRTVTKKHEAMLHQLTQQITQFKLEHKLNFYKKAKLGNSFKWTLREKGYDVEYVDQMTTMLMLKL
ncbi:hypothetical protein BH11PSE11_BH11PSE11_00830 [soil metagenome]